MMETSQSRQPRIEAPPPPREQAPNLSKAGFGSEAAAVRASTLKSGQEGARMESRASGNAGDNKGGKSGDSGKSGDWSSQLRMPDGNHRESGRKEFAAKDSSTKTETATKSGTASGLSSDRGLEKKSGQDGARTESRGSGNAGDNKGGKSGDSGKPGDWSSQLRMPEGNHREAGRKEFAAKDSSVKTETATKSGAASSRAEQGAERTKPETRANETKAASGKDQATAHSGRDWSSQLKAPEAKTETKAEPKSEAKTET
ncbi:MAG: hypothetical protein ACOYMN_13130, partial [Roseimicrobium sp.]